VAKISTPPLVSFAVRPVGYGRVTAPWAVHPDALVQLEVQVYFSTAPSLPVPFAFE